MKLPFSGFTVHLVGVGADVGVAPIFSPKNCLVGVGPISSFVDVVQTTADATGNYALAGGDFLCHLKFLSGHLASQWCTQYLELSKGFLEQGGLPLGGQFQF